jgi:Tol biopolymer transport system component
MEKVGVFMDKENTFILFIFSASEDAEFVSQLTDELAAQGFSFWSDHNGNHSDPPQGDNALRRAIRASSALLLVASPHTRSARTVKAALSIAQIYQRPVFPVWIHGETWMQALPPGWEEIPGIDARGERYPDAFQTLVQALRSLQDNSTAQPETSPSIIDLPPHPRNPFKGLRPFQREDVGDFFGREQCIDTLMHALREALLAMQPSPRLLAVIGPRGSGKSSTVMAGLLPLLQQGLLPQSHEWIYLKRVVPGQHPLESLAFALSEHFPGSSLNSIQQELEDMRGLNTLAATLLEHRNTGQLKDSPGLHKLAATSLERRYTGELEGNPGLHRTASALLERKGKHVLLFVDQFEELFTQTRTEEERQHFLDLLLTAMTEPQGPVVVLLALRADFYDRPLRYPDLGQLIEAHHQVILPMTLQEMRAAIEKPVQQSNVQLNFEDNLVGDLLFDAHAQAEALPLLQFTLAQLFEMRDDVYLTHQAYQELGGVGGALAKQAESTYLSLPSQEHQRWAQALFLRLIDVGTVDQDATARRIPLSELTLIDPRETAILEMVWKTFTEKRVLATSTVMGIPTIEVSHIALIGVWDRLRKWLQASQEDSYLNRLISKDANEWIRLGKPAERLYTGEQLAEAQRWRTRTIPSRDEDAFLQASIQQRQTQHHRTMRRTVVLGIAALGLTGGAFSLTRLLHSGEPTPVQTHPQLQTLPYTYFGHRGAVLGVAWSPDGTRIASASADQTVQVWDAHTGIRLLTYNGHKSFVISVTWSPDGSRIASASDDQTVQVWDAHTGSRLLTYNGHRATVWSVAWSPDGTRIASASYDRTAQVWDAHSSSHILTYNGHQATVNSVTWSPDSTRVASASDDRTAQVWDAEKGTRILTYNGHQATVESVAWSPGGTRIASASVDHTVQVWDAHSGSHILNYNGHQGTVNTVAWSPDSTSIASASTRTVRVWDAKSGTQLLVYKGHRGFVVYCVAWSPDGTRIASASFDQTVQIWSAD